MHFAKSDEFTIQKAIAISQKNECRNNGTSCSNLASSDISISSLKSSVPTEKPTGKHDSGKQGLSDNHASQTDTPLILPFP
ncbi:MAG TPA: hypothetical protein VJR67_00935 [Candidatus Nitrosopolaris sp.]|nr:hypothetical protein [Candidatus Nitrosopolaris sp.]